MFPPRPTDDGTPVVNEASSEILCEVAPRRFSVGTAVRERRVRLHCTDQLVHRVFLEGSCGVAASSLESLFIYFFFLGSLAVFAV